MSTTRIAAITSLLLCLAAADALAQIRSRIIASTMDSAGNLYVTGWRVLNADSSLVDIVTIKYDRAGTVKWLHAYPNNLAQPDTEPWGIVADRAGNVYVAGHTGTSSNVDSVLIKFPHNYQQGQQPEWVRKYDSESLNDQNWTAAIDPDGYVYTTGYSARTNDGVVSNDIATMKYDSSGTMVWKTPSFYNGPANRGEMAFAVAVDPVRRNVYVTGHSTNAGSNSTDVVTIMYDSSGAEKWVKRYGGPVNGLNRGTSLALDSDGNVYVAGWSQGTGSIDFVTIKYDLTGKEVWVARYDGPDGSNDQPAPPAGGASGTATYSYVQNNQGIIVANEVLDPLPALGYLMGRLDGVTLDRTARASLWAKLDACVVSLRAETAAQRDNAARTLTAVIAEVQDLIARKQISEAEGNEVAAVARQIYKGVLNIPTTVVYVAGQSTGAGTNVDFAIVKYDAADGRPMWNLPGQPGTTPTRPGNPANVALRFNGAADSVDRVWAMAANLDGDIYVTGPSMEMVSLSVDYVTVKYVVNTYEPKALGAGHYNGPGNGADQACGFATWLNPASGRSLIYRDPVTKADYVAVTGNAVGTGGPTYEFGTVMYDGGLRQLWAHQYFK
jgi:hypothetical protein